MPVPAKVNGVLYNDANVEGSRKKKELNTYHPSTGPIKALGLKKMHDALRYGFCGEVYKFACHKMSHTKMASGAKLGNWRETSSMKVY